MTQLMTEGDVVKFAAAMLLEAHKSPTRIKDPTDLPMNYGYYCLLSNNPVPESSKTHKNPTEVKVGDLFVWRDGAGDIRSTVSNRHLFRSKPDRRNGKKPNSMKVVQQPLEKFENLSHNFTKVGDGVNGYENGININESRWQGYEFYIVYVETEMMANIYEQVANDVIGYPPLNLQRKK